MTGRDVRFRAGVLRRRVCRAVTRHRWRTTAVICPSRSDDGRMYHVTRCRLCGQPDVEWLT